MDGCHMHFKGKPRGVEPPLTIRRFKNRKDAHTLNILVTAGFDHRIYDIVVNAPGSFHDAATWRISEIKQSRGPSSTTGSPRPALR